ncbi:MAG: Lrp/AsnC family transcriptional regulator [Candidatus Aenigmarchaeota archaeon]|nr:Lrp/AsnC family transcriptional regulator [Candidatus Aenigmarchaeota archaeon]
MVRISNLELIECLEKNARESFTNLAKKFGVSETAIRKRIRKLESLGVIKRYTVEVDAKKLGFEIDSLIGVDTTPEDYLNVIKRLKQMEEVKKLYSSTGDHMLLAECWFKNSEELATFVEKIKNIEGVTKVCPAIVLERLK